MLRELLVVILLPTLCLGVQGDLNEDGCVDLQDLSILANNWGKCDMSNYWLKNTWTTTPNGCEFDNPSQLSIGTDDFSIAFVLKAGPDSIIGYEFSPFSLANLSTSKAILSIINDSMYGLGYFYVDLISSGCTLISNTYIIDNQTHYIAITVDRDGLAKLYIDGALEDSTDCSSWATDNITFNSGGFCEISNGAGFIERFDQFIFCRGVIFDENQIALIYNYGEGAKIVEGDIESFSPVSAWYAELDEGTGNPVGRYYNGTTWANSGITIIGSDITWELGGTSSTTMGFPHSFFMADQMASYKKFVNKTSGAIQYRFKSRTNFQLRDVKLIEPEILGDR